MFYFFAKDSTEVAHLNLILSPLLGPSISQNRKISLDIHSQLYLAITVNILLWGCDSWALKQNQLAKLSSFHNRSMHQQCIMLKIITLIKQKHG